MDWKQISSFLLSFISCKILEMKGMKNHRILELKVMQIIHETPSSFEVHGCWLNATDISVMLPELQELGIKSWSSSVDIFNCPN
jgi:hypothetical protein